VTVAEEPGQISVRQSRFLTTGDVKPEEDGTTWWIPLGLKSGAQIKSPGSALTAKEDTIRDVDESFYKLNTDQNGFYRTNYPPDRLMQLGRMRERLSTQDKIGLMADASALAVAGDGTTAGLLTILEYFNDEDNYL
jgi:aminopeptidase N